MGGVGFKLSLLAGVGWPWSVIKLLKNSSCSHFYHSRLEKCRLIVHQDHPLSSLHLPLGVSNCDPLSGQSDDGPPHVRHHSHPEVSLGQLLVRMVLDLVVIECVARHLPGEAIQVLAASQVR